MVLMPKRFVGLHSHTNSSIGDGLGFADEHIEYVVKNGGSGWAVTDHGNMNSLPQALEAAKRHGGFKLITGVEAYFHPDLASWRVDYERSRIETKERKKRVDDDDEGVHAVHENEEETRTSRTLDPVKRRHHLVLLPRSNRGLQNLFTLVSRSNKEGYYRFPRVDLGMLKAHSEDVLALTACIAGPLGWEIAKAFPNVQFDDLGPHLVDDRAAMERALLDVGNAYGGLVDALGVGNVFLEIQFNRLGMQHLVNRVILEFAHRGGIPVVATCDSHYPSPDLWREREIYKLISRLGASDVSHEMLPKTIDELKCELCLKNAEQMWGSYKKHCAQFDFYDDAEIARTIELSADIADEIHEHSPTTDIKLPTFLIEEGTIAFSMLVKLCKEGMRRRKLDRNVEYVDRLKFELTTIKQITERDGIDFSLYFITMHEIIKIADENMLVGAGRGCFLPGSRVLMADGSCALIETIIDGDRVVDAYGQAQEVVTTFSYYVDEDVVELEFENGKIITCTRDHEFLTSNRGWVEAQNLNDDDDVIEVQKVVGDFTRLRKKTFKRYSGHVHDLNVANSNTYNVEKLAVHNSAAGSLICYVLGLTHIDPIKYGLIFERFINPLRSGLPDIDTDVADRDRLIDLMRERFGDDNVVPIVNWLTLQVKSLVKDVSKLYGVPFDEVNAVTGKLDAEVRPHAMKEGDNKSLFMLKYDDCVQYSPDFRAFMEKYPQVASCIKILYRQLRGTGKHASGVIVSEKLDERIPLIKAQGEIRTPWAEGMNRHDCEKYGVIKFDLLGLETLRIIQRAIELMLHRRAEQHGLFTIGMLDGESRRMFGDEKVNVVGRGMIDVKDLNAEDVIEDGV